MVKQFKNLGSGSHIDPSVMEKFKEILSTNVQRNSGKEESQSVSGQLHTYPSPNTKLTSSYDGLTLVGLGGGIGAQLLRY